MIAETDPNKLSRNIYPQGLNAIEENRYHHLISIDYPVLGGFTKINRVFKTDNRLKAIAAIPMIIFRQWP